ncbi:MAG TPA: inositol monophosphatase family protein [Solirubrobacteraceae bacterium]|jgi:myo-inositol-1(or 4)-monophosphatase|nr:inositol monophosphatase family protein [Solirubrobacteraceae bacterium]
MALPATEAALDADWLNICRRAQAAAVRAVALTPPEERARPTGRGEGGDIAYVIDRVAEDAIIGELESTGLPLTVISEERGEVVLAGGGSMHVIVDPIDGSRNAKRGLAWSVSIAVATGPLLGDVRWAYVRDGCSGEEWWAHVGRGAFLDGARLAALDPEASLELVGLEFIRPSLVAETATALASCGIERLRALGSIALTLCYVASGRLDGMITLAGCRSVDIAAGQLILREAGGALAFPDAAEADLALAPLSLDWRSRVFAAPGPPGLARLCLLH